MTFTRLAWPGLRNARDLGGLPTMDGGEVRPGAVVRADPAGELSDLAGIDELYRCRIEGDARRVAAAAVAVADAPPGAALVHCQAGQDRTGMLVALLLRVAGVADDVIVVDHTFPSVCWESPGECEPEP